MTSSRRQTNDGLARTVTRVVRKAALNAVKPTSFSGTDGDAESSDVDSVLDGLTTPMDDVGQMLYGEEAGALAVLGAPADADQFIGSDGPDVDGKFRPKWRPTSDIAAASVGRYRQPTYSTYGGGSYLFDSSGDAIYTLADLE